ncbi:unnamed protein product [Caenorhabditis bovis]|uniref:PID domain-containing protein n=1 Tax=Caenorhabditis bovis TaxID=2654633 RepID=A0A8S1F5D0_9PELO|nr:unnamed protein product [Caenorhabditis bovis]
MYNRIKSSFLTHFGASKSPRNLSREEKRKLRHSLAECQLSDAAHFVIGSAPLAEVDDDDEEADEDCAATTANSTTSNTIFSQLSTSSTSSPTHHYSSVFPIHDDDEPIMPHFALSWNVQYLGSFPISNLSTDSIGQRLERFQPLTTQNVELSVSLLGVRVSCEKNVIMSHSLRRISSVVGRPHNLQVAYIALEPAGRTYRRLCHVFQTNDNTQSRRQTVDIVKVSTGNVARSPLAIAPIFMIPPCVLRKFAIGP